MKKLLKWAGFLALASLVLAACAKAPEASDLLGAINQRGYILVSTDPNYEPQSFLNTEASRPADTKCPKDVLTTAEMQGFDVDVAKAIGDSLGVETCFATPDWDLITAGSWADKWDVSVGSMTITADRAKVVDFSVPYYGTPAVVAVRADSTFTSLDDLADQAVCAGTATTYETWLSGGDLGVGMTVFFEAPSNVTVVSLTTDQLCAQGIKDRSDYVAYVTAQTVVDENIAAALPVKILGDPVFAEDLAAAFDRGSSLDSTSLRAKVDELFTAMHSDGRMTALSLKWFDFDYTTMYKQ